MKSRKVRKKARASAKNEVWHISRFRERYELPEDIRFDRNSPLIYTKDHVGSGSDDESCSYWRQLMSLRSKPRWLELRGAFAELKNVAGNMGKAYRGFLLDCDFEPASEKEIGRWLGIKEKRASEIIRELEDVGLLERVDLPEFDTDGDIQPRRKNKSTSKRARAGTRSSKHARQNMGKSRLSRRRSEDSEGARKRTGTRRKARAPLKEKTNANVNGKTKAKDKVKIGNDNDKGERKKRQRDEAKSNAIKGPPTTTQPLLPQPSDAAGGSVIQFHTPPGSVNNNRVHAQKLGDIIAGMGHRFDRDSQRFGSDICRALGLGDSSTPQGRREIGSFGSLWTKAKASGLPLPVLTKLWDRSIDEARKIGKRYAKRGKPAAIWCSVFNKILVARCSETNVRQFR